MDQMPKTATFSVQHTHISGDRPYWYQLEAYSDREKALHRARNYALDHGGYVCVKDATNTTIYGTDPAALDHAITAGINRHFRAVAA
jgi:hypothetical protein